MKLLLHIGTHKTASTSIQHFCANNRDALQKEGYFYPRNKYSACDFNFMGSRLAHRKESECRQFLEHAYNDAQVQGCHSVLISAESFFAMTGFFLELHGGQSREDYWQNEKTLIEALKACSYNYESVDVICYVRSQEDYAASLYNQFVKNVFGVSDSYEEFVHRAGHIFDYNKHLDLWAEVFGAGNVRVELFSNQDANPLETFCEKFLSAGCYENADQKVFASNKRLSRDVLEFKRHFNATKPDRSLAYMAARCFRSLEGVCPDKSGYQIFAPKSFRQKFFEAFKEGNKDLCARYGLGELPVFTEEREQNYPGLGNEAEETVRKAFETKMNSPLNTLELFMRRMANWLMEKLPVMDKILQPVRLLRAKLRLHYEGW